jgi:hypothetical protein
MIPKLIHLHWFGDKPLPDTYRKNLDRWRLLVAETEWCIMLWDDRSEETWTLRHMLVCAGATPVQVSNLMRFFCLYLYGGMYVDFDIIPLRLPEFPDDNRLNLFTEVSWDTATRNATGEKRIAPNHAYMAAPPMDPNVLDCFWAIMRHTTFAPKSLEERLKGGVGIFSTFAPEWFDGVAMRGVNHFAPVNWAQARVLNMVEHYTYDQWLALAESFLQYPDVYGVHTFDSSWVFDLNKKLANERNPEHELDTSKSAEEFGGA